MGDHCLIVHDNNRPVNVYGYDSKAGLKHAPVVGAKTSQAFILLINQAIEMKGLDHHLLCLMQYCMNGVLIDKVHEFLALIVGPHMPYR